jgi:hypothetical protein
MSALPKIYVFCNSCAPEWHCFTALSEDGEFLANHVCSAHGYAPHDMGVNENGWKRELYSERYPGGFEVELVEGNPRDHAGLMAAHAKHVAHGPDGSPWQRERKAKTEPEAP